MSNLPPKPSDAGSLELPVDELLTRAGPLPPHDEMVIDDLLPDEGTAFLATLKAWPLRHHAGDRYRHRRVRRSPDPRVAPCPALRAGHRRKAGSHSLPGGRRAPLRGLAANVGTSTNAQARDPCVDLNTGSGPQQSEASPSACTWTDCPTTDRRLGGDRPDVADRNLGGNAPLRCRIARADRFDTSATPSVPGHLVGG